MKKKITKIILAVCLVVAGLPLFAIGARANDDANTNSEMMISVDNYFDYRNAKLMKNLRKQKHCLILKCFMERL